MTLALIVIDMQRHFLEEDRASFAGSLLPNIGRALAACRKAGLPVIHIVTRYRRDRSDWPAAWQHLDSIWCLEGTEGVEILPEVAPQPGEQVVVKTRYSGFHGTGFDELLLDMGIDALILAGYSADVCVRLAAMDAYNRGFGLLLLADCVHAARENTDQAIDYLRWLTNARITTSDRVEDCIRGQTR